MQDPSPSPPASPSRLRAVQVVLALLRLGPLLILLLIVLVLSYLSPVFFTAGNLGNVLAQSSAIAILAIGQLLVILTRGIDLSVGSNLALSAVVGALVFASTKNAVLVVLAMLLSGAVIGAANGFGYVFGKLPHPFIVTLATLSIARGLALGLSGGQPISGMPDIVQLIGGGSAGPVAPWLPYSAFLVAGVAILVAIFLTKLVWGRWIYAVGGSPEGARRLGIPRNWVLVSVYILSGLMAGIAAIVTAGRLNAGSPTFGDLAELDSIAAVVIGGASLAGGSGTVTGTIIGGLIMTVVNNGCAKMDMPNWVQEIVTGFIIVAAVTLDRLRRKAR